MLQAAIFDLDGLLIDSEPLWVRAEIEVFGGVGVVLTEADCGTTKGLRSDDVVAHWHTRRGFVDATPVEVEQLLVGRVAALVGSDGEGLPGIAAAIGSVRERGLRVALASSSPMRIISAALGRLGLADEFETVRSAEHEPFGKPHPGIFLATAEALGVSPLACVVLEDSLNGVIAAKAARMACIAVPPPEAAGDPRFAVADVVVASLAEVTPALLDRLAPSSTARR